MGLEDGTNAHITPSRLDTQLLRRPNPALARHAYFEALYRTSKLVTVLKGWDAGSGAFPGRIERTV